MKIHLSKRTVSVDVEARRKALQDRVSSVQQQLRNAEQRQRVWTQPLKEINTLRTELQQLRRDLSKLDLEKLPVSEDTKQQPVQRAWRRSWSS